MSSKKTALLLIGFQNDYFHEKGILTGALEDVRGRDEMLKNTLSIIESVKDNDDYLIISTPIQFTEDYSELNEPTGILKTIKETGAFLKDTTGSATIEDFDQFADSILEIKGKRGLNAFSNTNLEVFLRENKIEKIALAGVVTSVCIDSTGRSAHEKGFEVTILSDCTAGRTEFEQQFYCDQIFPLYASVQNKDQLLKSNSEVSA
ncbi:isochorismatase [bacterium TMED181]|nr:isochorismatase [Planctomycetota bacterium]OUW44793.1 MAG: isochorismatase [bacterium TMED181]